MAGLLSVFLLVLLVLLVSSPLVLWITAPDDAARSAPPGTEQVDVSGAPEPAAAGAAAATGTERSESAAGERAAAAPGLLRGTVVDPRGRPIAGATVFLAHPDDNPGFGSIEEFFENRETMAFWSASAPASTGRGRVLRTDEGGRFEFRVAVDEKRRLVAWHPEWQVEFVAAAPRAGATVVIELRRDVLIAGDVIETATGRRLEGISLALFKAGRIQPILTITTSATGEFEFPRVPAATYRLMAYGEGFRPHREPAGDSQDDHHHIELSPVERAELTLVNSEGAAWTGERLSALGFDPVTIEFVTTAYRARSRMDLELDLTASRLEFDPSTGRVTGGARPACSRFLGAWVGDRLIALGEVPAGAATVTLTPAPPGSVRTFTVVVGRDPTLAAGPCRGELFTCTSPLGHRYPIAAASAVDGVLAFALPEYLEPLDAWVEVTGGEREASRLAACEIPAAGSTSVQLHLAARAGAVVVRVRDDGRGRQGARVFVVTPDGRPVSRQGAGETGPDGVVTLAGLPAEPVRVVVDGGDVSGVADCSLPTAVVAIDLQASQSRSVAVAAAIGAGAGLCLRALDANGQTLLDDRLLGRVRHGALLRIDLPVGAARLEAFRPGHAARLAVAVVGSADPIRL